MPNATNPADQIDTLTAVMYPAAPGILLMQRARLAELATTKAVANALRRQVRTIRADGALVITNISNRHAEAIISLELHDAGYAVGSSRNKTNGDGLFFIIATK